jgi:hypothetical protein
MFDFFGKKKQKQAPRPVPIDLNVQSQNMSNRMNDIALKIDQVENNLKPNFKYTEQLVIQQRKLKQRRRQCNY